MPKPSSPGTEKAPCDKQSNRGFSEEKCLQNLGVEREKLFNWKDNPGKRTNMYKLVRKFKTEKTFWLQKTCNSQNSKVMEEPPKQQ